MNMCLSASAVFVCMVLWGRNQHAFPQCNCALGSFEHFNMGEDYE
jgi:hypothetical protein